MTLRMALSATARSAATTFRVRPALPLAGKMNEIAISADVFQGRKRNQRRGLHTTPPLLAEAATKREPKPGVDHAKVDAVFEKILDLDLVELHLVTELLGEKMGMSTDGAVPAGGGAASVGGGGGAAAAAAEEAPVEVKTKFDLKLVAFDAKAKIKVIKEVRTMTGIGLKEAKEMVEGAPKVLAKDIKKEEVEEMKAKLEAAGAEVELL